MKSKRVLRITNLNNNKHSDIKLNQMSLALETLERYVTKSNKIERFSAKIITVNETAN
jgi:hypothetical protein